MKLIPESLEESQNFERGLDPIKAMAIGLNPMEILFHKIHIESKKIPIIKSVSRIYHSKANSFNPLSSSFTIILGRDAALKKFKIVLWKDTPEEYELMIYRDSSAGFLFKLKSIHQFKIILNKILNESQNFERGLDPKAAMDIGVNRPLKPGDRVKILSKRDMEPFDTGEVIRIQSDGNIVVHSDWNNQRQGEIVLEPKYLIRESLDFQRGQDPKTSMGIGDAAILPGKIDSNILQAVSMIGDFTEEQYREFQGEEDPEEQNYRFVKRAEKFLKGKVTFGKYFDWKEQDEMEAYIRKFARGRYVYNATPGQDGWYVVFSKIHLPRAEEIDI